MSGVLVIGRTGQLARALAEEMPQARFLGREALDLGDGDRIAPAIAAVRPDLVINAAAYTDVDGAEAERAEAFRINAEAVGEIAEAAAEQGAALVHVSTDYVFDGTGTAPRAEDAPTAPLNVYGESKLAGERAALAANPRTLVVRTSWVVSPWGRNFVRTMLGLADREPLSVVADQHGAPTSALDLARAVRAIAPRLLAQPPGTDVWGVIHCTAGGETTWAGLARALFDEARAAGLIARVPEITDIPSSAWPTTAARPRNSRLSGARLERDFAVTMRHWRPALGEVVARLATPG